MPGSVGTAVLPCEPLCITLKLYNLSDDTADLQRAEFLLNDFLIECLDLPVSIGPWEEADCTIEDFVIPGFHVLRWYGLPAGGGMAVFTYPIEDDA